MRKETLSALLVLFLLPGLASAVFEISSTEATFESSPGEVTRYAVVVDNPTDGELVVQISADGELARYIEFETMRLRLDYQSQRDVHFKFTMPEGVGNVEGDLIFTCCNDTEVRKTHVILEGVEPVTDLLSVEAKPLKPTYPPGSVATIEITLFKYGETKKETIPVYYELRGPSNQTLLQSNDARTLETSVSYDYKFQVPRDWPEGNYTFAVNAEFKGFEASGSATFAAKSEAPAYTGVLLPMAVILSVLLLGAMLKYYYDKIKSRMYRSAYKPSLGKSFVSATLEMLKGGGGRNE